MSVSVSAPTWPLGLLLVLLLACSQTGFEQQSLEPVPYPVVTEMEPAVAEELTRTREMLERSLESPRLTADQRADAFGKAARTFHAYNLLEAAAPCYRNARRLDSRRFDWAYLLGVLYQTRGELEDAVDQFGSAARIEPDNVPTRLRLGELHLLAGADEAAEREFARVLEEASDSAAARYGLGRLALRKGDLDSAIQHFEAALELQPAADQLHGLLAVAYRRTGRLERAQMHGARQGAVPVIPRDPLVESLSKAAASSSFLIARGNVALSEGKVDEAVASFRRAVELNPEDGAARELLGGSLAMTGDLEGARAQLEIAVRIGPSSPTAHFSLGRVLAQAGDDDSALTHYRTAARLDPSHPDAGFNAGSTLIRLQRFEEALAVYSEVLEHRPHDRQARARRASLLLLLERPSEALPELERLLEEAPEDERLREQLAAAKAALGRAR